MEIYRIVNKITGKCYVGKTKIGYEKRFLKHKANALKKINRRLYDSMNLHGVENFYVELLCTCDSEEDLNSKEIEFILLFKSLMPDGYNMTLGGDGGYTLYNWSSEARSALYKQQSLTRTGIKRTEEQKKTMSLAQKGKIISEEQRIKTSGSLKKRYKNLSDACKSDQIKSLLENKCDRTGSKHSNETKRLMSLAKKGKKYEEIYSIEESLLKKEKAKERFISNNPNAYIIAQETKEYIIRLVDSTNTMKDISELTGVSLYKIRAVLLEIGINNLQKHRGTLEWKMKNENLFRYKELEK